MESSPLSQLHRQLIEKSNKESDSRHSRLVDNDLSSRTHLESCLEIMNRLTLQHIGLSTHGVESVTGHSRCMQIISTPAFDMTVFVLPANAIIPLHDHPNMFVLSKVLHGELQVTSFNRCSHDHENQQLSSFPAVRTLKCCKFADDDAWMLTPTDGNIHEFRTTMPTAVFEVITPPYSWPERPCSYYSAEPWAQPQRANNEADNNSCGENVSDTMKGAPYLLTCLEEEPTELLPVVVPYRGPLV